MGCPQNGTVVLTGLTRNQNDWPLVKNALPRHRNKPFRQFLHLAPCAERLEPHRRLRCKPKLPVESPFNLRHYLPHSRTTAFHAIPKQGLGHHGAIVCCAALLLALARRWRSLGCHGSSGARSEHFVLHQIAASHNPLASVG